MAVPYIVLTMTCKGNAEPTGACLTAAWPWFLFKGNGTERSTAMDHHTGN